MKQTKFKIFSWLCAIAFCISCNSAYAQQGAIDLTSQEQVEETSGIKKVLFLGDSMTGWMAERLNAYGDQNDFEVATIIWDGSTIQKWANSPKLNEIISEINPDAIMVSLGMNELFESDPDKKIKDSVGILKEAFGDIPFLWIGPPSWPGHSEGKILNDWLENELGDGNFFKSFDLELTRQSKGNPHPTKEGMCEWMDQIIQWIPDHSNLKFQSLDAPAQGEMSRGKTFIYKRIKESL